jgi:Asp-tRNA(Asn)/Glu-tRNA(Gln) amidotransferase A subunit family amidase
MNTGATSILATIVKNRGDARAVHDELRRSKARADEIDPWLRAFSYRPAEYVVQEEIHRPLSGLPIGVKDLFETSDMPTSYGSPVYRNHHPEDDSAVVSRIKQCGGVIFGKTATTEFAWRDPAPTANPVKRHYTPGGSSSGSAAAVGAGIVPFAIGTQTVGSIIRPAAFCGVVGYKPSFGEISTKGIHPLAPSLDHVGFFARSVEDVAVGNALFIAGNEHHLSSANAWKEWFDVDSLTRLRLLAVKTPFWHLAAAHQRANFLVVIDLLRASGMQVDHHELDLDLVAMRDAVQTILAREAYHSLQAIVLDFPSLIGRHVRELVEEGRRMPEARYQDALHLQADLRLRSEKRSECYDAVLTIPTLGEAPYGHADTGDARCCAPWSFLGAPVVSIPSGWSANGLPLGLQVVGQHGRDLHLLRVAALLEEAIGSVGWRAEGG